MLQAVTKLNNHIPPMFAGLLIVLTFAATTNAQEIDWRKDINVAIEQAVKEKKHILLHYTADWCRPCKQLDTFVFSSPIVHDAIQNSVIPVKVDVDLHPELVKEFNVTGVPYDVIVTPSGRVVTKRKSPLSADGYVRMVGTRSGAAIQGDVGEKIAQVQKALGSKDNNLAAVSQQLQASANSATGNGEVFTTQITNQIQRVEQQVAKAEPAPIRTEQSEMRIVQTQPAASARIRNPYIDEPMSNNSNSSLSSNSSQFTNNLDAPPNDLDVPKFADEQPINSDFSDNNAFASNDFVPSNDDLLGSNSQPEPTTEMVEVEPAPQKVAKATGIARIRQDMFKDESLKIQDKSLAIQPERIDTAPAQQVVDDQQVAIQQNQFAQSTQPANQSPKSAEFPTTAEKVDTDASKFALNGKCPVTLMNEGRWVAGNKHWGCIHRGQTYLFSSLKKLQSFQADPDRYSPLLAGFDPVLYRDSGTLVKGREENGVFMGKLPDQRVILFSNLETRKKFQQNPTVYLASIRQAMLEAEQKTIR